ncbi:hypothetical protein [Streptomyces sp. KMM 9044]|uniref:hypothetical protein n=1 Tax=Streptomyces sp. KMM 9044 TaxID=2744474 RepID=UPI002150A409|nr:hypothetical protein [Streptomyces sp. KMM 9044]WAX79823.1 hypothetical protein HUV60_021260 [Streptomyces sp. KMM 9044]
MTALLDLMQAAVGTGPASDIARYGDAFLPALATAVHPALATAVHNHAACLAESGRREQALETSEEALGYSREPALRSRKA